MNIPVLKDKARHGLPKVGHLINPQMCCKLVEVGTLSGRLLCFSKLLYTWFFTDVEVNDGITTSIHSKKYRALPTSLTEETFVTQSIDATQARPIHNQ
jgi:hypothetical protein